MFIFLLMEKVFGMRRLLPEMDFLVIIKLKQGITLCVIYLLESYFRSFYLEINISTLKMKLNH